MARESCSVQQVVDLSDSTEKLEEVEQKRLNTRLVRHFKIAIESEYLKHQKVYLQIGRRVSTHKMGRLRFG